MNDKTHSHCLPCEAESYTRNHYFTGKLMVERDFTDEQRYFREKIRLHHQRLHGSGVVCGLKILAHKEPCDNRYVILQPGSAVDCCGQDILVAEQDVIDLFAFPAFQDLIKEAQEVAAENPDATPPSHTLQLCISYKECPTEDIPVLYDECGCDDTQCAPNRILETYAIDLRVDPPLPISPLHQPLLDWNNTLNIAHAVFSILHEATQRLYVLNDEGVIYQISSNNYAIEASFALGREGLAIALNQDGTQLYAVVANSGGTAAGDADLWVFDVTATQLANGPTLSGAIPTSNNSRAQALVTSGNQLLLLFGENSARLKLWNAGVIDPTAPQVEITLPVNLHGLAQGSDGSVYAAQPGSAIIHQFDLSSANLSPATSTDSQAGANLFLVTPIIASGPDFLAVLDAANKRFRVLDPNNSNAIIGNIVLAHEPIDLVISNGGHWAYVLMKDGNDAFIQTINVQALRQGAAVVASIPFHVGDLSQSLVITQNAQKLFVPYIANAMLDDAGGVAVIDLREVNCHELLWPEDCPDCGTADCLVLATIENYRVDFRFLDIPNPASDPLADISAGIARINNRLGRKVLSSTQAIAEALQCLMDNCCGGNSGSGEQGPPGPQGATGPAGATGATGATGSSGADGEDGADGKDAKISGVTVTTIPCGSPPIGTVETLANGEQIIHLKIPNNCNADLVHICNTSWKHGGEISFNEFVEKGLIIRFDSSVQARDLHHHSVRLLIGVPFNGPAVYAAMLMQYLEFNSLTTVNANGAPGDAPLHITPLHFDSPVCSLENPKPIAATDSLAEGVWLKLDPKITAALFKDTEVQRDSFPFRIQVIGDFIRDEKGRALDGNHLPEWVNATKSGDRIQGGTFESYFTIKDFPLPNRQKVDPLITDEVLQPEKKLSVNAADFETLLEVEGIGPEIAKAIINARAQSPIKNARELQKIPGISKNLVTRLRDKLNFDTTKLDTINLNTKGE